MIFQKRIVIILIGFVTVFDNYAQPKSERTFWVQTSEQLQVAPRTSVLLLYQRREFLDREHTHQHLYWVSAGYKMRNASLGGGIMYFTYHRQLKSKYGAVPEIRPFQYVSLMRTVNAWTFGARAMLEERYLSEVHENEIKSMNHLEFRGRLRVNVNHQLHRKMNLLTTNELFMRPDDRLVQNRFTAEFGIFLHPIKVSVGYMYWYLEGLPIRHCGLLRVHHRINVKRG